MPKSLIAVGVAACLSLAAAPAQAHRGRDIAAFSGSRGGSEGVYVLHPRNRAIRRVSDKIPYFVGASTRVAWSPDRSKVAFEAGSEYSENIYVWNKRTGRVRRISDQPGREVHPSWSPDGTRIVYLHEENSSADLFVVRSDGTRRRRLTRDASVNYGPEWSPDGSTIVYPSHQGLFVIRPDGSRKRRLTDNTFDLAPSWAPGSRRLVFTRIRNRNGDGDAVLFTIRRDGSQRRRITDSRYRDEEPEWAPDGSRIVFVRADYRDGVEPSAFIHTVRPTGRGLRRVTQDISSEGLGEFYPEWAPGSKRIAYLRYHRERDERSRERNIWVMRRDGSRNRNVTRDGGPGGFFGLDW